MTLEELIEVQLAVHEELDRHNFRDYVFSFVPPPPIDAIGALMMACLLDGLENGQTPIEIAHEIMRLFDNAAVEVVAKGGAKLPTVN